MDNRVVQDLIGSWVHHRHHNLTVEHIGLLATAETLLTEVQCRQTQLREELANLRSRMAALRARHARVSAQMQDLAMSHAMHRRAG